jgi:hypothetical protein
VATHSTKCYIQIDVRTIDCLDDTISRLWQGSVPGEVKKGSAISVKQGVRRRVSHLILIIPVSHRVSIRRQLSREEESADSGLPIPGISQRLAYDKNPRARLSGLPSDHLLVSGCVLCSCNDQRAGTLEYPVRR